jgi:hypothetical protein
VLTAADPACPLQIGNGEFALTEDVTELQTFGEDYERGMSLGTTSQWGWHSFPNSGGYKLNDVLISYDSHGRSVSYPLGIETLDGSPNAPEALKKEAYWLAANPQRIHLGWIGPVLCQEGGGRASLADVAFPRQELDLWTGSLRSRFNLAGQPVLVKTICHPERDLIAVRVRSPQIANRRIGVSLAFAYASAHFDNACDWKSPDKHQTKVVNTEGAGTTLDATRYWVSIGWLPGTLFSAAGPHRFEIFAPGRNQLELVTPFSRRRSAEALPRFSEVESAASKHWEHFWSESGAIELSGSSDPRAEELERRIVLSQYLTAVNCAGSTPPQETGLAKNTWFGKLHLEMHWWHAAYFALWGRHELLERSLPWYSSILPRAQETASRQGYQGVRWPKWVGPEGRESPSDIGPFLIWQQPHPIYYAELLYRARPTHETLEKYRELVFETAEFMASYAYWDSTTRRYVLGPPLVPAHEIYERQVINPTFELAHWQWAFQPRRDGEKGSA